MSCREASNTSPALAARTRTASRQLRPGRRASGVCGRGATRRTRKSNITHTHTHIHTHGPTSLGIRDGEARKAGANRRELRRLPPCRAATTRAARGERAQRALHLVYDRSNVHPVVHVLRGRARLRVRAHECQPRARRPVRREVGSHVGREREREIEGGSEAALSTEEGSMWCTNSLFFLYEEWKLMKFPEIFLTISVGKKF